MRRKGAAAPRPRWPRALAIGAALVLLVLLARVLSGPRLASGRNDELLVPGPLVVDTGAALRGTAPDGKRLRVAFAVTITKDGPYLDGAAVLKHSVELQQSIHDVDVVAIVHPGVVETRPALGRLGIKVFEFEAPIKSSEIEGKHLRETIDSSGCCGALELLKLRAFQLTQYDRVVLLDMDTLIVKNLDHLFEFEEEMLFTYDYAMDNGGSGAPPVQGGFLVLRPSLTTYDQLIDIVREGDFRPGTGWAGSRIGWCWGGQTVQGLVSYYYNRVSESKRELNHCTYNAMVSTKDCADTDIDDVLSIHYTVCQKPWDCRPSDKPLCRKMIKLWWDTRRSFERSLGLEESTTDGCRSRSREYHSLPLL